jgi:hypothetical protein
MTLLLDDFMGSLEATIACNGPGRTVHFLGKGYTKSTTYNAVWYLKLADHEL